jgi:hypothetical protein
VACTAADSTTIDIVGVDQHTSIAIGADGLGVIAYYDRDGDEGDLKVAHCLDTACTNAELNTVDGGAEDVGLYASIAIGTDGLPLISYQDATNLDLKVAHCNDFACTTSTKGPIDQPGDVGFYTSIAIGADGMGLISFHQSDGLDLKVARCADAVCTMATSNAFETGFDSGLWTSIAIGADGLGLISHHLTGGNQDLRVTHCNNALCNAVTSLSLDTVGNVGHYTSLTIGSDGLGVVAYQDFSTLVKDLKVARCANTLCSVVGSVWTVDAVGDVGRFAGITMGADGFPLISYQHVGDGQLKVAHCASLACAPNLFQRR